MFHIVLYQPEIPPNTGNIIRLCANTGTSLHLIHPLGFELNDKKLRRAGLDYGEFAQVKEHQSLESFLDDVMPTRLFAISTKGHRNYAEVSYQSSDAFLFGPDATGRGAIEWGVYGIPETFVVNGKGEIAYKHVGPISPESLATQLIPAIEKAQAD